MAFLLADNLGRAEEAIPHAEKAVSLAPRSWANLDTLGWVHALAGNLERAEKFLRRSVDVSAQPSNQLRLARVFVMQGRWDFAQRAVEQAAILNEDQSPPDPELRAEINDLADDIRNRRGGS